MLRHKKCIAMLLAGGQGSRLGVLTKKVAKPAVPFGGKYRIIDFTLSNCVNSGIDTVGVLTQYKPMELNEYIGNGQPWGLDRNSGGVHILQPYARTKSREWYKGTANAIYQNINFVDRFAPADVVILSGDHIYKMDYSKMVAKHNKEKADCTIAVIDVPISEASRFGIMNTDKDGFIYEFEEKPKKPKSTKASMGVYVFKWSVLREYLLKDEENLKSSHDFGKNIIPAMLEGGKRLLAYSFEGYWKDVGTIYSLWEANMDLLSEKAPLKLNDDKLRVYARTSDSPPTFIADSACLKDSMITKGCEIAGNIENSIISSSCIVEQGAEIVNSIILPGSVIEKNASVSYAIVGENCRICEDSKIGGVPENDEEPQIAVVGDNLCIKKGETVKKGEMREA